MVERFSGQKLKAFRTDNGGEYTSKEYEDYLKKEGIRNEFTIPKTAEQNGVAERMNRTLVNRYAQCYLMQNFQRNFGLKLCRQQHT